MQFSLHCVPESFQVKICFYIHPNIVRKICFPGISELDSAGGAVGLNGLRGLFQPSQFHDSLSCPPSCCCAHTRGVSVHGEEHTSAGKELATVTPCSNNELTTFDSANAFIG